MAELGLKGSNELSKTYRVALNRGTAGGAETTPVRGVRLRKWGRLVPTDRLLVLRETRFPELRSAVCA